MADKRFIIFGDTDYRNLEDTLNQYTTYDVKDVELAPESGFALVTLQQEEDFTGIDYSTLINKPKINGVTLDGDLPPSALGIAGADNPMVFTNKTINCEVNTLQNVGVINFANGVITTAVDENSTDQQLPTAKAVNTVVEATGHRVAIVLTEPESFVYSLRLYDKNNNILSEQELDLPPEKIQIKSFTYDNANERFVFVWQDAFGVEHTITLLASDILKGVVTQTATQELENKTIDADKNTVKELTGANLKLYTAADKKKTWVIQDDGTWNLGKAGYEPDEITIHLNTDERTEVKDGGLTLVKFNPSAVATTVDDTVTDNEFATAKAINTAIGTTGHKVTVTNTDPAEHKYAIKLLDKNNNELSSAELDLPLEAIKIISLEYDNISESLILKWQDAEGTVHTLTIPASGILKGVVTETAAQTLTNKTFDCDANNVYNARTGNFADGVVNTNLAFDATDTQIPTALATKTYADTFGKLIVADLVNKKIKLRDANSYFLSEVTSSQISEITKDDAVVLTNKAISADDNVISALKVNNFYTGVITNHVAVASTDTELPTARAVYAAITETGHKVTVTLTDAAAHKYSIKLLDKNSSVLSDAELDLPLEAIKIISLIYDNATETLILKWQDADGVEHELKVPAASIMKGVVTETAAQTLTNKTINLDNNTLTNIEVDNFKSGVIVQTIAAAGTNFCIPTEKALQDYVDVFGKNLAVDVPGKRLILKDKNGNAISYVNTTEIASASSAEIETLTNKTIDADDNTITNLETDNFKAGVIATIVSTPASDAKLVTEKAAKDYADTFAKTMAADTAANTLVLRDANSNVLSVVNGADIATISSTAAGPLVNKSIDADNNTISNLEVDNFKSDALATTISSPASDNKLATEKAVKDYADSFGKSLAVDTTAKELHLKDKIGNVISTVSTADISASIAKEAESLENKSIDADDNTITNLETDNFKAGVIAAVLSSPASDTKIPSEKAVKDYVDEFGKTLAVDTTTKKLHLKDKNGNIISSVDTNDIASATSATAEELQNKTIDADKNTVTNLEVDNFKSDAVATTIGSPASDTKFPTEKAVKDYTDTFAKSLVADTTANTLILKDKNGDVLSTVTGADVATISNGAAGALVNKTIDADSNTIKNLTGSNLKPQSTSDAKKTWVVQSDGTWALGKAGSEVDDVTIEERSDEKIAVKDGGLTVAKFNTSAVSTAIGTTVVDTKVTTEKAVKDYVTSAQDLWHYVHTQSTAATMWVIKHNLHFYPNITVLDSTGATVEGSITYVDSDQVVLTFTAAISGVAYLS